MALKVFLPFDKRTVSSCSGVFSVSIILFVVGKNAINNLFSDGKGVGSNGIEFRFYSIEISRALVTQDIHEVLKSIPLHRLIIRYCTFDLVNIQLNFSQVSIRASLINWLALVIL